MVLPSSQSRSGLRRTARPDTDSRRQSRSTPTAVSSRAHFDDELGPLAKDRLGALEQPALHLLQACRSSTSSGGSLSKVMWQS